MHHHLKCDIIVLLLTMNFVSSTKVHNTTRTDLSKCKISHKGIEYKGFTFNTAGGVRCQYWESDNPLHKISPSIRDSDFPDGSKKMARNYCRNPTEDLGGPWCYTSEPTLIYDKCDIPLCKFSECRISGPGAEYGGTREIGYSGKKCKSWDKRHRLTYKTTSKFSSKNFPDSSRDRANNFCRNPDGDPGGPWCYVDEENLDVVEKEYCDVPFCDDKDFLQFASNGSVYSTLTKLKSPFGNLSFHIKLWNPENERRAGIRVLLSLLPIPSSGRKIANDWKAGVELLISNLGTGQIYPSNDDERDFEYTPEILLGSNWTSLYIKWDRGFVSLGIQGSAKPIFIDEYTKKNTISSLYPDAFFYYGILGTGVLWSTDLDENSCEVHTTFGMEFERLWPMQKSNTTYDVNLYLRASQSAAIRLYQSPGALYPYFTIMIGKADVISLMYRDNENSMNQDLHQFSGKNILSYWTWNEFTISIFGAHLRVFSQRVYGNEEIMYVNDFRVAKLRWFGIGSERTIAHWTLFCPPEQIDKVDDPQPPNCRANPSEYTYTGSQWTSENEIPCIPWISEEIPEELKTNVNFEDGSPVRALNKCRNPTQDHVGPYCFAIMDHIAGDVKKQYCPIRPCRSSECRMAGTANDYIGTLSRTRSGRNCAKWLSDYNVKLHSESGTTITSFQADSKSHQSSGFLATKSVHEIDKTLLNDTLYPEHSVINASNYCRDPSRNIAGTWCYTTDPSVPQDLCNVRDCEKLEECTFLVRGSGMGRRLYILPEHRSEGLHFSLKAWEPDRPDSITFSFIADDGLKSRYVLKIGASDNEKVLLYYQSENEPIDLVKKKTLPHLLYVGKWSSFVVQIPRGRVLLYYEGAPNPIFEWEHPEPSEAFLPIYYYYSSEKSSTIGVSLDCTSRCQIEKTETDKQSRILPLSIWSQHEVELPDNLVLVIRARGVVLLPLLLLPTTPGYYCLVLGENGQWIEFVRNTYPDVRVYHKQKSPIPLYTTNTWTNITVRWSGNEIRVYVNDTLVFRYEHRSPLIFYYFTVSVDPGSWATWAANCEPVDIDGPPVDGGWSEWSPWSCSVSCDGGTGIRRRLCDSPSPNVKGEPCIGPSTTIGRCNTILCGDVTEDTVTIVKRRIGQNHTALTVKEGRSITVEADEDVIRRILTETPRTAIKWSLNGLFLTENSRIKIKNYNIVINKAFLKDSGVYALAMNRVDGSRMILKIVSLAVIPISTSVTVRETMTLIATCHCVVLGYVYSDLRVAWSNGKKTVRDYGVTLPVTVNVDHIPRVNRSHAGMWKCVVRQDDLGFQWITNILLVKIIGPPNWRTHLMEDKLTRFIFGWMPSEEFVAVAALLFFFILIACIIIFSILFIRSRGGLRVNVAAKVVKAKSSKTEDERKFKLIKFLRKSRDEQKLQDKESRPPEARVDAGSVSKPSPSMEKIATRRTSPARDVKDRSSSSEDLEKFKSRGTRRYPKKGRLEERRLLSDSDSDR